MVMAYWNGMKWEIGSKQIAYLESLTTAYSIDTDTNADKEGKKPTETVGLDLIEVAFNTTYRIETGTSDIRGMLKKWESMVGKSAPLIIGNAIFGPDKMQLQSVSVSNIALSPNGIMRAATLSFKLKEFAEEPAGIKKSTGSGSGSVKTNTAVSVGATSNDKSTKKTVSINNGKENNVIYMPSTYYLKNGNGNYSNNTASTNTTTHTSSSGVNHGGGGSSR